MLKRSGLLFVLLSVVIAITAVACGGDDDDDDDVAPATEEEATPGEDAEATEASDEEPSFEDVTVTMVGGVEVPDYTNLMDFAARDILAEQGIEYVLNFGFEPEVAVQQLVEGRAQTMFGPLVNLVPAMNQGAPLITVSNHSKQSFAYAAKPEITTIDQLAGTSFAVHSEVSFTKSVTDALIQKYEIPDVETLIIAGSEVRLQTLAAGQIDATTVDISDVIRIGEQQPEAINILSTVSEEFPELVYVVLAVNTSWFEENPDVAQAVVDAYVAAAERLNSDREYAISLAEEVVPDDSPEVRAAIIDAFLENGIWNATDISEAAFQETLIFLFDYGQLEQDPANADINTYLDLSLLN